MNHMTLVPNLRALVAALAILLHSSVQAEIDWTEVSDLSASDKAAIEELARNAFLFDANKVTVLHHFPSGDRSFAIRGGITSNGKRQVWQELVVCRAGEGDCRTADGKTSGGWRIGKTLSTQERWRFSDGDWFVDVELGTGISYAEAEAIVLAIRRQTLRNTPELERYKNFDASSIRTIHTNDPITREFSVVIGGGGSSQFLFVRIEGNDVVLYEFGTVTA
jgi:hypothetical protein